MTPNEELQLTIDILMRESLWGQNSTINSLVSNLQSEVQEFINACKNNNARNAWEEASDVLMILLCILQKNYCDNGHTADDLSERIIEKLHRRYSELYANTRSETEEKENLLWENAKVIEHQIEVMFCTNKGCQDCYKAGNESIRYDNSIHSFVCTTCGHHLHPSAKNSLFFRYKNAHVILNTIRQSVVSYSKGIPSVAATLFSDNNRAFHALCNQLEISEKASDEYSFEDIIAENIYRNTSVSQAVTKDYLNRVRELNSEMTKKDNLLEQSYKDNLLEQYCRLIAEERYNAKDTFSNKDWKKIKSTVGDLAFDVVRKIEKTLYFSARSWDNQVNRKYLLSVSGKSNDIVIECMTILHYKGAILRDLTIEISNMYNCVVGCKFCASGALPGKVRKLGPIDFVKQVNTCIAESGIDPNDFENFYVSFAGIGEPSAVYKEITGGMVMIRDLYPNVQFNIATCGYQSDCFAYWDKQNLPIRTLQIPLYHIDREKLREIVTFLPDEYSFIDTVALAVDYMMKHSECRIKVNYIPFEGINDSDDDVGSFIDMLQPYKSLLAVKVSYLNFTKPAQENGFVCPGTDRLKMILQGFLSNGYTAYLFGTETNTTLGCGQLAQSNISNSN